MAAVSLTSSLRSCGLDRQAIDRRQLLERARGRRRALAVDSVSPVAKGSSRASATVSPACGSLRLICLSPASAKMPPMRASPPRGHAAPRRP